MDIIVDMHVGGGPFTDLAADQALPTVPFLSSAQYASATHRDFQATNYAPIQPNPTAQQVEVTHRTEPVPFIGPTTDPSEPIRTELQRVPVPSNRIITAYQYQ